MLRPTLILAGAGGVLRAGEARSIPPRSAERSWRSDPPRSGCRSAARSSAAADAPGVGCCQRGGSWGRGAAGLGPAFQQVEPSSPPGQGAWALHQILAARKGRTRSWDRVCWARSAPPAPDTIKQAGTTERPSPALSQMTPALPCGSTCSAKPRTCLSRIVLLNNKERVQAGLYF